MTNQEMKKNLPSVFPFADKLTPEQLDYCVRECSSIALTYYTNNLSAEQFDHCVRKCPAVALAHYADKLSTEQFDYCKMTNQ